MNYLETLNKNQYEAVTSDEQYLRIIAGAGSGKTRVLSSRIAYLIEHKKVSPSSILAITFTNKVAKEMIERTFSLVESEQINKRSLNISTFHAFCAKFLRFEITKTLGFPKTFSIIDDEDQLRIIKNIAEQKGHKKSDSIVKESLGFIGAMKTLGKMPSDISIKDLKPNQIKYLEFFKEYETYKNSIYSLDFDDLLIYSINILENFPEVRLKYQKRFKHILIDEFQDTNDIQFKLLRLLSNQDTNIFVVGDPDQTIYTWRGANQSIILDFEEVFHPLKSILLVENYRSTSKILNSANKLIKNNKLRIDKDLFTNNGDGDDIGFSVYSTADVEASKLCDTLDYLKYTDKNFKFQDVAILYRSNYLSLPFEKALVRRNIPYKIYSGIKFYSRKEIKDCLAYFKLLLNENDDFSFQRIINVPRRSIGEKTQNILAIEASQNNLSIIAYLKKIHTFQTELRSSVIITLTELIKLLDETRDKIVANNEAYSEVLQDFLIKIGYFSFLADDEKTEDKVENVNALIDDIRNFSKENPDNDFFEYLQNVMLLTSQDELEDTDNVTLMTVHTAKGLEYNYIFLVGFSEGVFPNARSLQEGTETAIEEERRLAYVAFTRAKKKLFVSCNKDYNYTIQNINQPSRFAIEAGLKIPEEKKTFVNTNNTNSRTKYIFGAFNENANKTSSFVKKLGSNNVVVNNNKIDWNVGDTCYHNAFHKGIVEAINGDVLTINFEDFGKKMILSNHPSLKKGE